MHFLRSVRMYILAAFLFAIPATSFAGLEISVRIAPPVLPVYTQPVCPGDGYIWTPGYWAYGPDGYYWVPGTWAVPPQVGLLWTPGYWGFEGGIYAWHGGYWGSHVGFYGGVDYGYGYGGAGYEGGHWDHNRFFYNTAVSHVNVTVIHNTYHTTVVNRTVTRVSYNGGPHGVNARPNADQQRFDHEQHFQRTTVQEQHEHFAASNRQNFASENHGRPPAPAMSHNIPRPNNQPRNAMGNNQPHNNSVPRPSNSGFHGDAHNQPVHNNAPAHNEQPHAAQHSEPQHKPAAPAHGNEGHGGDNHGGGDHHDHH
jgi:hypothetical protein